MASFFSAEMKCFRGCGGGGRKFQCKALSSCVFLLFMVTTMTAQLKPNVSQSICSAVPERLLTDELVAIQEIERALKRNVELITNNFSWIKVALLQLGILVLIELLKIFTGVLTQYLVDLWRKAMPHWNSQVHPTMEDLWAAHSNEVADLRAQLATALNQMATTSVEAERQSPVYANEVVNLQARLAAMLNQMTMTTVEAERQSIAFANEVMDLQAQLAVATNQMATTTTEANRQSTAFANEVMDLRAQLAASMNQMATTRAEAERQSTVLANEVVNLQAQLTAVLNQMAMTTAEAERQSAAFANEVVDLQAQLAVAMNQTVTTTAKVERQSATLANEVVDLWAQLTTTMNEMATTTTNVERQSFFRQSSVFANVVASMVLRFRAKMGVDWLEECLKFGGPCCKSNLNFYIWPAV